MRILHVSSFYPPDQVGGAELLVERLAREQLKLGHVPAVICGSRAIEPPAERGGVLIYRSGFAGTFPISEWASRSRPARMRYKLALQLNTGFARRVARAAAQFRPDVINTHSLAELPPGIWPALKRAASVPIVHTLHDFSSLCTNGAMFRDGRACPAQHLKCRAFTLPHRLAQPAVDAVIGVGRDILERHLAAGFFADVPETLREVIWNPIDATPPAPAKPAGTPLTFGFIGRIEPSKGVDALIEACRKLPPEGWRLLIAGRAVDGLDRYRALAHGLPIEFAGFVEIEDFYSRIDWLIAPPLWPEAFGRTVAEAQVRGIPVLGTRIAGVAEQIEATGFGVLTEPGNVEALADAMRALIAHPEPPRKDAARLAAFDARIQPEGVTRRYLALYERARHIHTQKARSSAT